MAWDFSRDRARAFAGPGTVPVECDGRVFRGFVTDAQELVGDGLNRMAKLERFSVSIDRADLPDRIRDQDVVVNGEAARVREVLSTDDGNVVELVLVRAED